MSQQLAQGGRRAIGVATQTSGHSLVEGDAEIGCDFTHSVGIQGLDDTGGASVGPPQFRQQAVVLLRRVGHRAGNNNQDRDVVQPVDRRGQRAKGPCVGILGLGHHEDDRTVRGCPAQGLRGIGSVESETIHDAELQTGFPGETCHLDQVAHTPGNSSGPHQRIDDRVDIVAVATHEQQHSGAARQRRLNELGHRPGRAV